MAAAIAQALGNILSPEHVVPYPFWSAPWPSAIAQAYSGAVTELCLAMPKTVAELAAVVTVAHQNRWRLLVAGQGTKLGWGNGARSVDLVLSTHRLNRLIDHAVGDMTVTVQAGIPFAQVQAVLAQHRQWIPLDPAYIQQSATVGGIVASRDAGSLRHRYGGVRDLCLGLSFVRSDGQIAKAGGRVVKNVAGYDLMKLFTGSFGTLGILTELTLRTYPLPDQSGTILVQGTAREIAPLAQTLLTSTLTPTALDLWTGLVPHSDALTLALRFQSVPESVVAQVERVAAIAQTQALKTTILEADLESDWWFTIGADLREGTNPESVKCQIGVLPAQAVTLLGAMHQQATQQSVTLLGRVHLGSGVGHLRLTGTEANCKVLLPSLRKMLEQSGGYLSILEAPATIKQAVEVWGYAGNALSAMGKLKKRFDPQGILNPGRFVGGI